MAILAINRKLVNFSGGHFEKALENYVDHGNATGDISNIQKYNKNYLKKLVLEDHGGVQVHLLYMSD